MLNSNLVYSNFVNSNLLDRILIYSRVNRAKRIRTVIENPTNYTILGNNSRQSPIKTVCYPKKPNLITV